MCHLLRLCFVLILCLSLSAKTHAETENLGTSGFIDSSGTKIHYVTAGQGPLVVMIHGFPDYWYSWREQIPTLSQNFKTVAIDQRGYNRSDQPADVSDYQMDKLVSDVIATVDHFSEKQAILIGHDWGGAVAWSAAMAHPDRISKLVILNLPHLRGLQRELANNPKQQAASAYARAFQIPGAERTLSPRMLARWVQDEKAREKYVAAFERSSLKGMLDYYRANYPRPPYQDDSEMPPIQCPVLVIFGLQDKALLAPALNDTWEWIDKDLTLVTIPTASHFVQQDEPEFVTGTIDRWLRRPEKLE